MRPKAQKDDSHRAVTDKLGIKTDHAVRKIGRGDPELLERVIEKSGRKLITARTRADIILYWPKSAAEITPQLVKLKTKIVQNGGIWVFTAKKGLSSQSGMDYIKQEDVIPLGLAAALVDNKSCSASARESALRFVIRKADRS